MNTKKNKLLLCTLLFALTIPLAALGKAVHLNEPDSIGYFKPVSILRDIEKRNKGVINPSMSNESVRLLDSILVTKREAFHLGDLLLPTDTTLLAKLNNEISHLAFQSNLQRKSHGLELSSTIDSVMEANGQRYALAIVAAGYSRSRRNYSRKEAMYIAHRISMLGQDDGMKMPDKATSTIHALLFDAKDNTVAIYRKNHIADKEPLNKAVLSNQMTNILVNVFVNKVVD